MIILRRILLFCLTLTVLTSCKKEVQNIDNIVVTIAPLKHIVASITANDFHIEVLLSPGANPENYEPTPQQLITTSQSHLLFSTGLMDFEKTLVNRIKQNQNVHIVEISQGIPLIEENKNSHHHTVDPHIWTSPNQLKQIATNVYNAIALLYPDSAKYALNYNNLCVSLDSLDYHIRYAFTHSDKKEFLIYHPALSYYARDYGLTQIPLEKEGKEPSAEYLKQLIQLAQAHDLRTILYQKQFSQAAVKAVADILHAKPIEIDPLGEDISAQLLYITKCIATQDETNNNQ